MRLFILSSREKRTTCILFTFIDGVGTRCELAVLLQITVGMRSGSNSSSHSCITHTKRTATLDCLS